VVRRQSTTYGLRFLAGKLCLDFVNSVENRAGSNPEEFLTSYTDFVEWGQHRNLLDGPDADRLLAVAAERSAEAAAAFETALALREALYRVFHSLATGADPDADDLVAVQRLYAEAITHARLRPHEGRYGWEWSLDEADPDPQSLIWPIAFSAVELLTEGERSRIRVCANPDGCGWLFFDSSKNGSRRWCSMEGCGSQVKMRRQYAKRARREPVLQDPAR
jgi:predicted RNA-binding Zn ribbon-like protein